MIGDSMKKEEINKYERWKVGKKIKNIIRVILYFFMFILWKK